MDVGLGEGGCLIRNPTKRRRRSADMERPFIFVERLLVIVERLLIFVERLLVIVERLLVIVERLLIFVERPLIQSGNSCFADSNNNIVS